MPARTLFVIPLAVALAGAAIQPAWAQPKPATVQAAGSEIGFTTRQMGVPVEGTFGRFNARITLDLKQPQAGNVALEIETGSARFGSAELDAEVPKPTWLNVAAFPRASFQSSTIKPTGPGRFEVTGKLAIKGSTRDLVVPVLISPGVTHSTATGSFTIKRLDFKVGEGEWADTSMLANDVQVRFKLVLSGLGPL